MNSAIDCAVTSVTLGCFALLRLLPLTVEFCGLSCVAEPPVPPLNHSTAKTDGAEPLTEKEFPAGQYILKGC